MNSKRVFYCMIALVVILSGGVIAAAYESSQLLAAKSKKLTDLKLQNKVLDSEQISLTKAKKDIAKYQPLADIAKTIVPQDKDQAESVREINNLAAQSGFSISTITLPTSNLGLIVPSNSSTSTGTSSAAPAPKTALSQLTPVKGQTGLYVLPITVTQDPASPVPYAEFIDFLNRLEQNRRTAQVSNITLQPNQQSHNMISFNLTLNEYIKP